MNFRCRALLDLAYQLPCQLQIDGVCEGGMGEPCHSNQQIHGKGQSTKAHDCFFAAGCRPCHEALDNGCLSREEAVAIWRRGADRTLLLLWQLGKIRVS